MPGILSNIIGIIRKINILIYVPRYNQVFVLRIPDEGLKIHMLCSFDSQLGLDWGTPDWFYSSRMLP